MISDIEGRVLVDSSGMKFQVKEMVSGSLDCMLWMILRRFLC